MIDRPHYFNGQMLSADDVRAEQDYFLDRLRAHNRLHGWGVVCGLAIEPTDPPTGSLVINPGIAIDACGREIVVKESMIVPVSEKLAENGNCTRAYLLLSYGEELVSADVAVTGSDRTEWTRVRETPVAAISTDDPEQRCEGHPQSDERRPLLDPCPLVIARIDVSNETITATDIEVSDRRKVLSDHAIR